MGAGGGIFAGMFCTDEDYRGWIVSAKWRRARRAVLSARPLCERCAAKGLTVAAQEVHHRRPVSDGVSAQERQALMWNGANLEALCHGCHVARHVEMGRSGKVLNQRRRQAEAEESKKRFF